MNSTNTECMLEPHMRSITKHADYLGDRHNWACSLNTLIADQNKIQMANINFRSVELRQWINSLRLLYCMISDFMLTCKYLC